jgi:hypothetical protein
MGSAKSYQEVQSYGALGMYEEKAKAEKRSRISSGLQLFGWIRPVFSPQGQNLAPVAVLR